MKNQYFGDVRDLFKYDLIQRILKEISYLEKFTFIPMLTKYDPKGKDGNERDFDGAKKDGRPGTNNKELMKLLEKKKQVEADKRDFTEIEDYFNSEDIGVDIYKGHEYFDHGRRDEYFENIPEDLLRNYLVFVDPDNGLKIKNSGEKHLLYDDVKKLYERMDEDSILMIYQHFPREKHIEYLCRRASELKKLTEDLPIYISDNEIIFFLLTKNDELRNQLERIISRYKRDYRKRIIIGNVNYNGM